MVPTMLDSPVTPSHQPSRSTRRSWGWLINTFPALLLALLSACSVDSNNDSQTAAQASDGSNESHAEGVTDLQDSIAETSGTGALASAKGTPPPAKSPAHGSGAGNWLTLDITDMEPETGLATAVALPAEYADFASNSQDPKRSVLVVEEDGELLGPSNSVHKLIRETGMGAYSHWGQRLLFTSSDNSDPRSNGRTYRIRIP